MFFGPRSDPKLGPKTGPKNWTPKLGPENGPPKMDPTNYFGAPKLVSELGARSGTLFGCQTF